MERDYERGIADGLKLAAEFCDQTASELDEAAASCEVEGDQITSDTAAVGAVLVRHTAAYIRTELGHRSNVDERTL